MVISVFPYSISCTGSDGDRRESRKVSRRTPKSVGTAWTRRRAMKRPMVLPRRPAPASRPPFPANGFAARLLLVPPLLDVPRRGVGVGHEVLQLLVREGEDVRRVEERVGSVLVQVLIHGVERLLSGCLAAVRAVAVVDQGLVDGRARVADVVELTLALLAGVPDRVRVRVRPERPADDEALIIGTRIGPVEERVE